MNPTAAIDLYGNDLGAAAFTVLLVGGYHLFMVLRLKYDPLYTVQAVNSLARTAWVEHIMKSGDKDLLAVQTLRNSTMAATFLASTAALLVVGTLTLTEHSESLGAVWGALNTLGSRSVQLWQLKLLLLIGDFLAAFVFFSQCIRLLNHVGFMINVPLAMNHKAITPQQVARHLNRAGLAYSLGMRSYYFSVPLVFWLFGPVYMAGSAIVLVAVLYNLDRAPKSLAEKYRWDLARPEETPLSIGRK
ncbi:MAG: DUF599 domain-containing protein [Burkholderiales bacterium]